MACLLSLGAGALGALQNTVYQQGLCQRPVLLSGEAWVTIGV